MDEPASEALTTPATDEITNVQDKILNPNAKCTLTRARTVDNHTLTDKDLKSPDQIPDYILKTLMIVNYHARDFELKQLTSDKSKNKSRDNSSDESEDEDESEDSDLDESDDKDVRNPMDGLLWVFHHSDTFLRRTLAVKLSACQLSVPFLLPDPADSKNVTILLSALESITKSWKSAPDGNDSAQEVFATEYPFPVVSFIRTGEVTMSKSLLLNKIMSDGNCDHNFFFHKNIQGGDVRRKVVDGLVELSWYLPGGREKQILQKEICFANLRGEARLFEKQVNVLLNISSVLCVLLPSEYPDENITKILKEVTQSKAKVILIFNEKNQPNTKKYFNDLKKQSDTKLSLITKAKERNEFCFFQTIRENINKNTREGQPTPLVELASCASQYGIRLDDDQWHFELEKSVDTWLNKGVKKAKSLLELQIHVPVLSDLEREKYRPEGNKSETGRFKRDTDEIYKNIEAVKEAQRRSFEKMDKTVLHYLKSIASMDKTKRNYSLTKVKHQLDKMSLQTMTKLYQEYRVASLNLQKKEKETRFKSNIRSSEEHLKQLEESISKCSFGLEHIIRELAQLYQLGISKIDYAGAAAEMLLSGMPLELLDGDSSYIPLQWFNAVYRELERKTNNAKIFVISVLGLQSSGKSTMLNTMFGLEFPVSAGRCTRGAFASLIPVSDSLKFESKFDYMLIIDTEGLRRSKYLQLREHDNKSATFAIGVADVTIVNIFGENHNDIKEFLEMAVHAFLKMKLVKQKKAFKIVHQNVVATDAADKLMVSRFNLKQDLDKMTRAAAIEENCEELQKINDIILFDENEDVFYIPSFFIGSPPMAPVNPHYGRAVQKIKENIITLMCAKQRFRLSVSEFQKKVVNLWKAILQENFIFSFRNITEVQAFTSLDRKYFEESVKLIVTGMAELERKIQVTLSRCQTRDEREEKWKVSKDQIRKEAENLKKKLEVEMERFFETSENKETLEQWKKDIMNKIKELMENQSMTVTKNCSASFDYWQKRQNVEEKKQNYEKKLLEKAKTFVTSAHDTEDVQKCKAAFEQEWQQWIIDVPPCQESKIDVNSEMLDVLCGNVNRILNADMAEKLKHKDDLIFNFKEIDPVIDLDQLTISYLNRFLNKVEHQQDVLMSASRIKDKVVATALEFAKMTSKSGVRCTRNDFTQMYHKVITTIDKETDKCRFKFSKSLKCDILLYTFANAYSIFNEMEERYIGERDIRSELKSNLRPRLETYFLNLCSRMEKELLAATSIVDVLQEPMESNLNHAMGNALIAKLMKINPYRSKGSFHASVLIQLGKEKNFELYIPYLKNSVIFLRDKLMESIKNYCLKNKPFIVKLLKKEAEKIKNNVFDAISKANEQTNTGSKKLTFWIQQFVENCSTLGIKKEMFAVATIDDNLNEIDLFEANVRKNVTQFLDSLMKREIDEATLQRWNPSPYYHMFTSMFGCQACCPFCDSLCDYSDDNHVSLGCRHSTIHRPQCLSHGYNLKKSGKLHINICPTDVASKAEFQNAHTSWKWHQYKDYQSVNAYYKSWAIPSDQNQTFEESIYWQWFMANFSKELAEHHKAKEPKLPSTWKNHKFENVKEQLELKYEMHVSDFT